jgi:uncharacterized membrane protein YhaH (DUF805 family)
MRWVWSLFSSKGRIGRKRYWIETAVAFSVMGLGLVVSVLFDVLAAPIGSETDPVWSQGSATFVQAWLAFTGHRWIIAVFILVGLRIDLCSAIKRARDLGVDIRSALLVPLYLFNPFSKARIGRLLAAPGVRAGDRERQTE